MSAAREIAISYAARHRGDVIRRLLERAGGNVSRALELCHERQRPGCDWDRETIGHSLTQWGFCGPDRPNVEAYGSAPHAPILVWSGGIKAKCAGAPADIRVTWREVFEYVAGRYQPALPGF